MTRLLTAPLLFALIAGLLTPPASAQMQSQDFTARKSELMKAEETLRADELLKLKKERDEKAAAEAQRKLIEEAKARQEANMVDATLAADRNRITGPANSDPRSSAASANTAAQETGPTAKSASPGAAVRLTPQEELFYNDLVAVDPSLTEERFLTEYRVFGRDLFARPQLLVAPSRLPAAPDYRLGPDDGLLVHVWNATVDEVFPVEVTPEGRVILPKLGEKFVDGFDLANLERHLTSEYGRIYSNASVSVSLSKLKSVTVFVIGEVAAPGSYNLPGYSTALNALVAAGGPTANGSFRGIVVKRVGEPDRALDLYDFLLSGDRTGDRTLRSGDTVFVPVVGPQVLVHGPVRRPGLYEIRPGATVADALGMAGGLSGAGFKPSVRILRSERGERRALKDVDIARGSSVPLADGDLILVAPVFDVVENYVRIMGHVERPGRYQYVKGMRLLDLIGRGKRLLPNAHLERAELVRYLGEPRQFNHAEDSVKREVRTELIPVDLRKVLAGDREANLPLKPMDELNVFSWGDVRPAPRVQIAGAVMRPGSYDLKAGMRIKDLVYAAGNLTKDAMMGTCEVMRRVVVNEADRVYEERLFTPNLERAMAGDPGHNLPLENFDVVTILAVREETLEKRVTLSGEVKNPGVYVIRNGERLSSVLRRAGGFSPKAFPQGAVFTRESVKEKQRQGMRRAVEELKKKVSQVQAEVALRSEEEATAADLKAIEDQKKRMDEFSAFEPNGRVNVNVLPPDALEGTEWDLLLVNGDKLHVPPIPADVTVVGEVVNPGSVLFEEGKTLDHYVNLLGGYNGYADERRVFITRANGTTITRLSFGRGRNRFFLRYDADMKRMVTSGSFSDMKIERGDVITVPARVVTKRTTTKEIVDLVYKISLSYAGVKAAINK